MAKKSKVKNIRKKRKNKDKFKDKDEGFFGILFFLASIYVSIIIGSSSIIRKISSKTYLDWQAVLPSSAISLILLGVILIVSFYLFVILVIGILEFSSYYSILKPTQLKVKRKLRKMVLGSPLEIFLVSLSLGIFLVMLLLVYFKIWFAVIMGLFYISSFIIFSLNLSKVDKFISSMTIRRPKPNAKSYVILGLMILLILSTIYVLFGVIIFNLAEFDINLDKELYHSNESAYITIYSKGIIKPIPYNIKYSNLETEINYIKHLSYGLAPIYIKLNSSNLTEYPYNSYIKIYYNIPKPYSKFLLLRENLTQSQFIPVINS